MKKFLLGMCSFLLLTLGSGEAFAETFLVIRDTPLMNEASATAKQIDTFKKGMLVNGNILENNPEWCKIEEFKPLDTDFLYIHLRYANDCAGYAYVAVEDLMPAATVAATEATTEPAANTETSARIAGTLVDYLKPVTAADIACDGRVDEQALLSALQQWVNDYNYLLATISKKPEDKLVQSLVSNPDKILDTLQGEKIDALEAVAEPVLNTWAYEYDYEAGKLTGADKKIWDLLARYGLGVDTVEGWPFLQVDTVFFRSCFKVSPDAQAMINLLNSQPQKLYVLQGLNYGLESLAKFALEWEDYMVKNPNSPYLAGAAARYKEIVNLLLFCDLPYTPMFSKNNGNKISQEDKDTLRGLVQANTGTFTAKIIEEFLTAVEKNKDKQPKGLKENLASQMDKNFKGAAKKAPATKKLSALEQKIAGKKHMFSLQWIEGGKMGEAVVKQTADGLYIEAKQEHNGDYVVLQGDLTVIDDKTFTVTGDIVTRVSHIADGNVCPRSGTFEFFAKGSRKYWRLQQMTNPCDNVVDYVDVYF